MNSTFCKMQYKLLIQGKRKESFLDSWMYEKQLDFNLEVRGWIKIYSVEHVHFAYLRVSTDLFRWNRLEDTST